MNGEIDSRVVTYRGVKFRVDIDPDEESRPDDYGMPGADDAAYTDAGMEAWRRDEWRYVCVTVSLCDMPHDLGLWDSLCSVEWGRLSEVTIGTDDIARDYLPDLASEVIGQIPEHIERLSNALAVWGAMGNEEQK